MRLTRQIRGPNAGGGREKEREREREGERGREREREGERAIFHEMDKTLEKE